MSTELEAALAAVIRRLGSIAVTNPELIAELRQLAQHFLKLTEPPAVEEPGTTEQVAEAVLLAIRWSSHSYGEVRDYCEKHGKHFVRLPGGYNPNQVAHQILQQRGGGGT